jgi:general secretion pathway protein G
MIARIISFLDPRKGLQLERRTFQNERGLTLIEIIVVLILLGVISSMVVGRVFKAGDKAKAQATVVKMEQLKGSIGIFQMKTNALPRDLKEAEVDDASDSWGREIQYRSLDGSRTYELRSLGADGREGGSGADSDIKVTGP